jgi:predicted nucleic acid-binding protein
LIVVDTSGVLAALDDDDPHHPHVRAVLAATRDRIVLSPFVLAELDYMLNTHVDARVAAVLLEDVERGAYLLAPFSASDVGSARRVLSRYGDLGIGLADASIVVLAARYGTTRILTLDERHFRALRSLDGRPFTLLPGDARG